MKTRYLCFNFVHCTSGFTVSYLLVQLLFPGAPVCRELVGVMQRPLLGQDTDLK